MDKEEHLAQEERDRLLTELVVRVSALEMVMVKKGILTQDEISEALLTCMTLLKEAMEKKDKNV